MCRDDESLVGPWSLGRPSVGRYGCYNGCVDRWLCHPPDCLQLLHLSQESQYVCVLAGHDGLCGHGLSCSPMGHPELCTLLLSQGIQTDGVPGVNHDQGSVRITVGLGVLVLARGGLASVKHEFGCGGHVDLRTGVVGESAA